MGKVVEPVNLLLGRFHINFPSSSCEAALPEKFMHSPLQLWCFKVKIHMHVLLQKNFVKKFALREGRHVHSLLKNNASVFESFPAAPRSFSPFVNKFATTLNEKVVERELV